jgi:hypothetical protein
MNLCKDSSPLKQGAGPTIGPAPIPDPSDESAMSPDAGILPTESRSRKATQAGAQAFARLLHLAEERDSGQIRRIARFLAAVYNGEAFRLDPFELRAVDIAISDDMLLCLDALRWARADLHTLVPDGDARMRTVIERWGLQWPADD